MRASRGLKWENKMYKLKRSLDFLVSLTYSRWRLMSPEKAYPVT